MIGNLNYDQVSQVVEVLKKCNELYLLFQKNKEILLFKNFSQ